MTEIIYTIYWQPEIIWLDLELDITTSARLFVVVYFTISDPLLGYHHTDGHASRELSWFQKNIPSWFETVATWFRPSLSIIYLSTVRLTSQSGALQRMLIQTEMLRNIYTGCPYRRNHLIFPSFGVDIDHFGPESGDLVWGSGFKTGFLTRNKRDGSCLNPRI